MNKELIAFLLLMCLFSHLGAQIEEHVLLEDYPGVEAYPQQPMMSQIRKFLDDYTAKGGSYEEVSIEGAGHVPFMCHADEFNRSFHAHLARNDSV